MRKWLHRKHLPAFLFVLLMTSFSAKAADYYVPGDYTTVQDAIDNSNAGDVIHITGTYTQPAGTAITVNKSVTILGEPGAEIQTSGTNFLFVITAANVTVRDLEIEKTDDNINQNIIQVLANDFELDNCDVHALYAFGDGEVTRGLEITGNLTGLNIHDNTFRSLRQPAYINNNVTGTIANNLTKITRGWVVVSDCNITFTGNSWGTGIEINYYDIVFINQSGSANNYPDIVALSNNNNNAVVENQHLSYPSPILSIVRVQAGASGGNGSTSAPYPTVAQSIPRVAEGGKVFVAAGTYAEEINVTKNVFLIGANAGINAVTGVRSPESLLMPSMANPIICIRLSSGKTLSVDGFQFDGFNFVLGGDNNNLAISNCMIKTVADQTSNCIYLAAPFKQFTFAHNDMVMTSNCQATLQPVGNYAGSGGNNVVSVTGNRFTTTVATPGSAVKPVAVNLSDVQGTVSNNLFDGIDIGILLANGSGNITIEKNTFTGLKRTASETSGGFFGAGVVLFQLAATGPVNIKNNFFSASDVGVRTSAPPPVAGFSVNVNENSFTNMLFFHIRSTSATQLFDATCNWHGTNDVAVIASKIVGLVTYEPWLTRGTDADLSTPGFQPVANSCNGTTPDNDGDGALNAADCAPFDPDASTAPTTYYADNDGDGFGDPDNTTSVCSATPPAGYVSNNSDCDDSKVTYADADGDGFGAGSKIPCGTVENNDDCDDTKTTYADNDGDGFGAGPKAPCGATNNTDCNDNDASINAPKTYYKDGDGDGHGDPAKPISVCSNTPPAHYVANNTDCDDNDNDNYLGAPEICDGDDNDCDGLIDEGVTKTWYKDGDGDGWGNSAITMQSCSKPTGYVYKGGDCDDAYNKTYPGAPETCDGKDNDCDGHIDEGVGTLYYRDADGDGWGSSSSTKRACTKPTGYVTKGGDCNDSDNKTYPGAKEICDGKDNDCDGKVDEYLAQYTYYKDADGDGYGDASCPVRSCSKPTGYVTNCSDCNDRNKNVYPGAKELCDGLDNDCDGKIDEGLTQKTFYRDADGDGWGNSKITIKACSAPAGYVSKGGDCNDSNKKIYPGAPTKPNGVDDDCSNTKSTLKTSGDVSLAGDAESENDNLTAAVHPNPSSSYFTIRIGGVEGLPVQLRVFNALGQVQEAKGNLPAQSTQTFGHTYLPGMYFVEVSQQGAKVLVKCIKQ